MKETMENLLKTAVGAVLEHTYDSASFFFIYEEKMPKSVVKEMQERK